MFEHAFDTICDADTEPQLNTNLWMNQRLGITRCTKVRGAANRSRSFTKSWADEYGPSGVRVNAVAPGPIATERAVEFAEHVGPMLARIPSRRMTTPEEVAAAVTFLASDDASNIHGVVLSVDGGWAAT